jgi:hypothetical protein
MIQDRIYPFVLAGLLAVTPLAGLAQQSKEAVQPKGAPIMTPKEEAAHEEKMHSFKTYEACKAYFTEHLRMIEARAKEQGRSLRNIKRDECETMRDQGAFKAK